MLPFVLLLETSYRLRVRIVKRRKGVTMIFPKGAPGTICSNCVYCAKAWIGKKRAITYCKLSHDIVYSHTPGCVRYEVRITKGVTTCHTLEQIPTSEM